MYMPLLIHLSYAALPGVCQAANRGVQSYLSQHRAPGLDIRRFIYLKNLARLRT
jgi:hypothetical protein